MLRSTIACVLLAGISFKSNGQIPLRDINSIPIAANSSVYAEVEGSPFITTGWSRGLVKFKDGRSSIELQLKYDQVKDELMFKTTTGDSLLFVDPVSGFKISVINDNQAVSKYFRNGYSPSKNTTEQSYFEVVADGPMQLLKRTEKHIVSSSGYNVPLTKSIASSVTYYLSTGKTLLPVKNSKKAILSGIGSKSTELEAYSKNNNLDFGNDADLARLVIYYNSLSK